MVYYCYYYSTTTMQDSRRTHEADSTVPMRRTTCFDGPALVATDAMGCASATTTTVAGVPGSLSAKTSYVCTMGFWQMASGL